MKYFETNIKQVTKNLFLTNEGYKIYSEHSKFAVSNDKVLVKNTNDKYYVYKIIERCTDSKFGVVFFNKSKQRYCIKPFNEYITYYISDISEKYVSGTIIEFIFSSYDKNDKIFLADTISEYTGDYQTFKIKQLYPDFTQKVLDEVIDINDNNKLDLSSETFITLNGDHNKAFSFETTSYGYRMKIAVPDISLLRANTYTNNAAYTRGFSTILDKKYGILPDNFVERLEFPVNKNALCLIINMDNKYNILNYCFVKASITISKMFEINEHLELLNNKNEYYSFFNNMKLAGAFNSDLDSDIDDVWTDISHRLAGEFISRYGLPFPRFNNGIYETTGTEIASFTNIFDSYMDIMVCRILSSIINEKVSVIADISNDCQVMNTLYSRKKEIEKWYSVVNDIKELKNLKLKATVINNHNKYSEIKILHNNKEYIGLVFQDINLNKNINVMLDIESSVEKLIFTLCKI